MQTVRRLGHGNLPVADICASFQEAVADIIVTKALHAAGQHGVDNLVLCGGVAANRRLRGLFEERATEDGRRLFLPSSEFCTDNAAMIAVAGFHQLGAGMFAGTDTDVFSRIPVSV
jgi:N6-L-threonylcarbamoyladenine synthase